MIDLDVFTPSDDRAVRLVVGKTADGGLAGPANGGDARTANTKPAPNNEPASHVAAAVGGDGAGASVSTDTESTAALKEVQQTEQGGRADRQSAGARPSSDGGAHQQAGIKPRPSIPPKPVNDDFPRIQVIGSIR